MKDLTPALKATDPNVPIDLTVRALLANGAGRADVTKALR